MIEIIPGDFLDFDLAHASAFQAMITDPPYSAHVHANITSAGTMGKGSRGWHRQELEFGALTSELRAHIAGFASRVRGWSAIYSDFESAHEWVQAARDAAYVRSELVELEGDEDPYSGLLPWERWSQPQKSGDRPTQGFEVLSMFWGQGSSRKAWNGPGSLTCLRHKCLRGRDKHRTEKPLDQALDLVSWLTNAPHLPWEGATVEGRVMTARPAQDATLPVLDPCLGSGTTAVACALLGRACVGFELLTEWAEKADRRMRGVLASNLSDRDRERAERWVLATLAEASTVARPRAANGSDVKTWERAQRRLADAHFVAGRLL